MSKYKNKEEMSDGGGRSDVLRVGSGTQREMGMTVTS